MRTSKRRGDDNTSREGSAPKHHVRATDELRGDSPAGISGGGGGGGGNRRKSTSARTKQACKRCKDRKIKCDALSGGCSPCKQSNNECVTTDLLTGQEQKRGHAEQLERENNILKADLSRLTQQLKDVGLEPKLAPPGVQPGYMSGGQWGVMQSSPFEYASTHAPQQDRGERPSSQGGLPEFRPGCIGDNYLGVSSENHGLSAIGSTTLSLFGSRINITDFVPADDHPICSAMSYSTFLSIAYGGDPDRRPAQPPLPSWDHMEECTKWYFRMSQVFIPILDKANFMSVVRRAYKLSAGPEITAAEWVMVHSVVAVMTFQFSVRNDNTDQKRHTATTHYHYALSLIPKLIESHQLEDIQALTLICSQLRSQPRPGAAWMFTSQVLGIAIEAGLHRSAKAWPDLGQRHDPHRLEMRKRTFWTLLAFHSHMSGKLGRPMWPRPEDFDIEIPDIVDDAEGTQPTWNRCSFRVGIEGFKLLRIMREIYATIYTIKSTGQYEENVYRIGQQLRTFQQQLPPELDPDHAKGDDVMSALYLKMSVAGYQLLLHHPSLCRSQDPVIINRNLDVCLDWSGQLLKTAVRLRFLTLLDTSWWFATDFLAAIFTTLFVSRERRDTVQLDELQKLQGDMEQWLGIIGDVGHMLGTGPSLELAIRRIISFSLQDLRHQVTTRPAHPTAAVASAALPPSDTTQPRSTFSTANAYHQNSAYGHGALPDTHLYPSQTRHPYPPGPHVAAYNEAHIGGHPAYVNSPYDTAAYGAPAATDDTHHHHPLLHSVPLAPGVTLVPAYQQHHLQPHHHSHQQHGVYPPQHPQPAREAWHGFSDSLMTPTAPHDFLEPTHGLLGLGGEAHRRDSGGGGAELAPAGPGMAGPGQADGSAEALLPWPQNMY